MTKSKNWSVISSESSLLKFNFREIFLYRDLIRMFVRREIVTYYKQTILGPLWFLIQPVLTTIVFTLIFGKLAKISTDGLPPVLFYLAGVTAWNFFADSFKNTADTFKKNEQIFGKVYFPRVILPLSIVISGILKFLIQFALFLIFVFYFILKGSDISLSWYSFAMLPVFVFIMGLLGLSAGMIISSLTTKYRDLTFLIQFGVQLLMYATPVIYPVSVFPEKYRWLIEINPMTGIIEGFRFLFLGDGAFSLGGLMYSLIFSVILFFLALIVFNRTEKNFMDTV